MLSCQQSGISASFFPFVYVMRKISCSFLFSDFFFSAYQTQRIFQPLPRPILEILMLSARFVQPPQHLPSHLGYKRFFAAKLEDSFCSSFGAFWAFWAAWNLLNMYIETLPRFLSALYPFFASYLPARKARCMHRRQLLSRCDC